MMRGVVVLFCCLCVSVVCVGNARASTLFVDLAQDHVDITTGFNGAELVLHGVKEIGGDIAIVIQGGHSPMVVRLKERIVGMWVNKGNVKFKAVPVYYDYALSDLNYNPELAAVLEKEGVGIDALFFDPKGGHKKIKKIKSFQEALIRNKQEEGLFPLEAKSVTLLRDNFFKASFIMPSNLPVGYYEVETLFIRGGEVKERWLVGLNVGQVGLNAHIYKFAQTHSLAYGLICIFIAALIGWGANKLRRED